MCEKLLLWSEESIHSYVDYSPLVSFSEWWHLLLVLFSVVAVLGLFLWLAIKDRSDQSWGSVSSIFAFRVASLAVLLLFFFNIERRREEKMITPSRIDVIIDTSLSMSLGDSHQADSATRFESVQKLLQDESLWSSLVNKHDLHFLQLDSQQSLTEVARLRSSPGESNFASNGTKTTGEFALLFAVVTCISLSVLFFSVGDLLETEKVSCRMAFVCRFDCIHQCSIDIRNI